MNIDTTIYAKVEVPSDRAELATEMYAASVEILRELGKRGKGCQGFEDDYVVINLTDVSGATKVEINLADNETNTVLHVTHSVGGHEIKVARPGKWCDYIRELREKAATTRKEREEAELLKAEELNRWRFSEVDDSEFFN